jgi:hypothetical protein
LLTAELFIQDFNLPTKDGIITASALISPRGIKIASSVKLKSEASNYDRTVIKADKCLLLPTLFDYNSWVSVADTSQALSRYNTRMAKGGITSGYLSARQNISRVGWMTFAEKIKQVFDKDRVLFGPPSYVNRWRQKEQSNITPQLEIILSIYHAEDLMHAKNIDVCKAQNHHHQHKINHKKSIELYQISESQYELIDNQFKGKHNEIMEQAFPTNLEEANIKKIQNFEANILGITLPTNEKDFKQDRIPYFTSLLLYSEKLYDYKFNFPLRSKKYVDSLRTIFLKSKIWRVAVGNDPLIEPERLSRGLNFAENVLPMLFDFAIQKKLSFYEIYQKLFHDSHQNLKIETLKMNFPENFVLIGKRDNQLDEQEKELILLGIRPPKKRILFTQSGNKTLYSSLD